MPSLSRYSSSFSRILRLILFICLVSNHKHDAFTLSPTRQLPPTSRRRTFLQGATTGMAAAATAACCADAPATITHNEGEVDSTHSDDDILISLFGNKQVRDEFLNVWNQGKHNDHVFHCHISRTTTKENMLPPPLSGIDMVSLYETSNFISQRIRGSHDILCKNTTSYQDLCQYIARGGSAIVSIIESDYMHPTKVQIQDALGRHEEQVSMNVYHSGPHAVALNIHYDSYNVLVLQLAGQKEWILQQDGKRQQLDSISTWHNITMMPGDVLYIPKGVLHAATTKESLESKTSTHVTIGLFDTNAT